MYNQDKNRFLLPAMIIRGGTSKGVYLLEEDLPEDKSQWDSLLLSMMGSPDKKQIDGLGGAQSVTSKVAIARKCLRHLNSPSPSFMRGIRACFLRHFIP